VAEQKTLDELLSEAQLKLRDGHNDHLARAIARARNLLTSYQRLTDDSKQ
jgi:hypothetical protein